MRAIPVIEPRKHRSGPSGPSGAHQAARRALSATPAQWARWDREAARAGLTWADWVRQLQDGWQPGAAAQEAHGGPFEARRLLSASAAQWRAWSATARRAGLSWSDWARRVQDAAAK